MPSTIAARVWLAAFDLLRRHPRLPGTRRLLLAALRSATSARGSAEADARDPRPRALAAIVRRAARVRPHPPSCLAQALALQRLLAGHGLPARVRLGLDPSSRPLRGHAWVECGGRPVGPAAPGRYLPCETS